MRKVGNTIPDYMRAGPPDSSEMLKIAAGVMLEATIVEILYDKESNIPGAKDKWTGKVLVTLAQDPAAAPVEVRAPISGQGGVGTLNIPTVGTNCLVTFNPEGSTFTGFIVNYYKPLNTPKDMTLSVRRDMSCDAGEQAMVAGTEGGAKTAKVFLHNEGTVELENIVEQCKLVLGKDVDEYAQNTRFSSPTDSEDAVMYKLQLLNTYKQLINKNGDVYQTTQGELYYEAESLFMDLAQELMIDLLNITAKVGETLQLDAKKISERITENKDLIVGKNYRQFVKKNKITSVEGKSKETIAGTKTVEATGKVVVNGDNIELNGAGRKVARNFDPIRIICPFGSCVVQGEIADGSPTVKTG